jgi:selenide,water dikinase
LEGINDPNVITPMGDDAGVYRLSADLALVQTVDFFAPIVDDPFVYGQISAANALSDIYAMGARPKTALNIVAFPDDVLPLTVLMAILQGGKERTTKAGCALIGGHSVRDKEIKYGMAVTGTVHPDRVLLKKGAKEGDRLILTKPLGTGVITTARKKSMCRDDIFKIAVRSMVTLNEAALPVMADGCASAATDVTGFGLAGHALEMATASGLCFEIRLRSLPLFPEVTELISTGKCFTRANKTNAEYVMSLTRFEKNAHNPEIVFDPQTSGGILMTVPDARAEECVKKLRASGAADACEIGRVEKLSGPHLIFV